MATHYRFTPRRVAAFVAPGAAAFTYIGLRENWLGLVGWWPFAISIALLGGAVGYWVWDARADERHAHAMVKFALVNKWEFAVETPEYRRTFVSFPFGRGRSQRDTSWISGTFNGRKCATFTHEYEEADAKERTRREYWQITLVELQYPLATIDIVPDDAVAKAAKAIGGMDIDFESADFNARWRVMAGNLKYAHDIIHPRMMERLLKPDAEGLAIRIEGPFVMCWQSGRHGPESLARRLGVLTSVAKLIPDFVLREFEHEWKKREAAARKREEDAPNWAKTPYALTSGRYTELGKQLARDESKTDLAPGVSTRDDENRAW